MKDRAYRQRCGVAKALDVIGERWTLLIVRELMLGPKRFGALRAALPGLGPTLLSQRLAALTEAGLVEAVELPPPASVSAYRLTARGEGLRPTMEAVAVWGFALVDLDSDDTTRASWLATTMAAAGDGDAARRHDGTVAAFAVDGDRFVVRVGDGRAHVRHGAPEDAHVAVACTMPEFWALANGKRPPVALDGDPAALDAVLDVLRLPAPAG